MARDSLALLDHLGWKSKVHVVGLSMGGMISQELCRQDPDRFASLTLLSTISGGFFSLGLFVLSIPTGLQLAARTFLNPDPKAQLQNGLRLLYPDSFLQSQSPHPETGEQVSNFRILRTALIKRGLQDRDKGVKGFRVSSIFKQALSVFTHSCSMEELENIAKSVNGKVIVITGDEDILVHPYNADRLHKGLKGEMVVIPKAGHGANEQASDQVNQLIEQLIHSTVDSQQARL